MIDFFAFSDEMASFQRGYSAGQGARQAVGQGISRAAGKVRGLFGL